MKKKVLVTGANGQLGRSLQDEIKKANLNEFDFLFADRNQLDISNNQLVETFFFANQFDVCVNCAAYTAVDLAETEVESAFQTNADGVKYLAQECKEQDAVLIHVSTDYVFDGMQTKPYKTNDTPNPINVYGKSKWEGEKHALEINPKTFVVRTSWLYSDYGKNFYTTMLKLMKERDEIHVVDDQMGKPTEAHHLSCYILGFIAQQKKDFGIHHFADPDQMTWFEFAKKIKAENKLTCTIIPISTDQYPTPAKRPLWSVLDSQ